MRFLLAVFESTGNPLMYSLLRDYFPPSKRVLTTSIVGSTINLGVALSSLSLILIDTYGWQVSYYVTSSYGIAIGIIAFVALREPKRGQFDNKKLLDKDFDEEEEEVDDQEKKAEKGESFFGQLVKSFIGIIK